MVRAWFIGRARKTRASWSQLVVAVGVAALFLSCAAIGDALAGGQAPAARDAGLYAVIRRTEGGFPHIESRTWKGLGYGFGYAFAQDDLCTMAEDYVTVDAQRSRYFGPNGSYSQPGNGTTPNNLDSDLFWQQIIDSHVIDKLLALHSGPNALSPQLRQGVEGYVDGYNRYLSSVGGSRGVPDPRCRGKAWVHPITVGDAYRRFYQLVELASQDVAIDGIAQAQPPTPGLPVLGAEELARPQATGSALSARLRTLHAGGAGSNAVAIGSAGTRDHRHGLLLGNPHFPWIGDERFYELQFTMPGKVNVSGMTLFGVPIVLIGHTMSLAWSHTVSTAFRFTPFQLTLVPGDPTSYLYDGKAVPMTTRKVTVEVKQPDGTIAPQTRMLYWSRFGPIFNSLEGIPLPWTTSTAFALGDANATNSRIANTFFDFDHAGSVPQMLAILKRYEGIPWVNTIVADKYGNALYADIGTIPNVPNSLVASCDTALGAAVYKLARLPILDGSRSACNWRNDPDAVAPGLFGPSHLPYLLRSDYVTNSNNSYWLSNPHHPLTGYAGIIGDEGTARSLRTRIGLIMTQARIDGTDHQGPPGFTVQDMENMVFSNLQYAGVLWRDQLVNLCRSLGTLAPTSYGAPVAIGTACDVLAGWDLHENLDSHGAVLFRRFVDHAMADELSPFSTPFNVDDPVNTPSGLNTSDPEIKTDLGDAIADLQNAHIPLDASPGQEQYVATGEQLPLTFTVPTAPVAGPRIPIPGGVGDPNGEFDAIYAPFVTDQGYAPVYFGSSFVQVVGWNNGPCPIGATILTYSESDSTASPHHTDQTRLFSEHKWVPDTFCPAAVLASTKSTTVLRDDSSTKLPGVKITKTRINRRRHTARFSFKASARARAFQCALVRRGRRTRKPRFKRCRSPTAYAHLKHGRYTFEVRARTQFGVGPIAKRKFAI